MTTETKEKARVILENFLYLFLLRLALILFFFAFKRPFVFVSQATYVNPIAYYFLAGLIHWHVGGRVGKAGVEFGKLIVVAIHLPYFIMAGVTGGMIWPSNFNLMEYGISSCVFLIVALTSSHWAEKKGKGNGRRRGDRSI